MISKRTIRFTLEILQSTTSIDGNGEYQVSELLMLCSIDKMLDSQEDWLRKFWTM
ncbi:collagen triple helix repeat protein [Salmonella phage 39]|nr:collagen triple helix repeat protein [Salmonella phage 39]